jgi:hypothetical protein
MNAIVFGCVVTGRKTENRMLNHFIKESFSNFKYYSIVNSLDIVPALNFPVFMGKHSNPQLYVMQTNNQNIHTVDAEFYL